MLFLLFHICNDRYVLQANRVVEVIPMLELKRVPHAPPALAGLINYRGQPVPAVDLSRLILGQAAPPRFSTRIIIIQCDRPDSSSQLVGLIAERATEVLQKSPNEFVDTGLGNVEKAFLGPVLMDPEGPIQWIKEDKLLDSDVRQFVLASASPPAP